MVTSLTLEKELCGLSNAATAAKALVVEDFIPEGRAAYLRRRFGDTKSLCDQVIRYAAAL